MLLLTFALTASADRLGYSKDNPLLFGIDIDYPPLEFVDEKGFPHGSDVDFTQLLMKRLDIPFTYAPNTWEDIAGDVLHGKVDLGMMVYSTYRKDITNYSRAVLRLYYQIVYRKADKRHYSLRDIEGMTIAFMKSRPILDTLTKAGAKPIVIENLGTALRELSDGKYDAVICYRYQTKYYLDTYGLHNLTSKDLPLMAREYCYVSNNAELIKAINEELDKMEDEGVIDDVYDGVKSSFGRVYIPMWVWYTIAAIVFLALLVIIVIQRRSRKRILQEMVRAQRSEQLKDIFLGNLSHALLTPMNSILGFSELLMSDERENMPEDEKIALLGMISKNGKLLQHFLNELLELSDIEGNNQLFVRCEADIKALVDSYVEEARQYLQAGVQMEVQGPSTPLRAVIDTRLFHLVTLHLLQNACRYTSEGFVKLNYMANDDGLYVEVRDTGNGIPDSFKENLFSLLTDEKTFTQDETPGLGLSVCKAILDKAGGAIGARDNDIDGRGTIVWFRATVKILSR